MPSGSRPGERRGGRKRGVPNRATVERAEIALRSTAEAKASGRKLGKEVLEELMVLFGGLASKFQPESMDKIVVQEWTKGDREPMFHKYASLAVKVAKDLADFQSPRFKAVEVHAPAPNMEDKQRKKVTRFTLNIFDRDLRPTTIEPP